MILRYIITVLLVFSSYTLNASEFKLICENNKLNNTKLNPRFSKVINLSNQTIENISGNFFDKLLIFKGYELIMINDVFKTTSSYNFKNIKWTVFNQRFVDIYECKKKGISR